MTFSEKNRFSLFSQPGSVSKKISCIFSGMFLAPGSPVGLDLLAVAGVDRGPDVGGRHRDLLHRLVRLVLVEGIRTRELRIQAAALADGTEKLLLLKLVEFKELLLKLKNLKDEEVSSMCDPVSRWTLGVMKV